jgi:hypothetical protein
MDDAPEVDEANTLRVLVATDLHVGYKEKHDVRGGENCRRRVAVRGVRGCCPCARAAPVSRGRRPPSELQRPRRSLASLGRASTRPRVDATLLLRCSAVAGVTNQTTRFWH